MSEKFLKKQGQKQENAQAGQKLRENDRLTDEELEQIVGGGKLLTRPDGTVVEVTLEPLVDDNTGAAGKPCGAVIYIPGTTDIHEFR